jgi:uncharacterized membrane protein required for colicin V production
LNILIDLAIVAIVVFCGWRGFKNGLIRGAFGVVTLVAALFIANIVASAYSEEFTDMLNPFIGGRVDSELAEMMEESADEQGGMVAYPAFSVTVDGARDTAFYALRRIGLPVSAADNVAERTTDGTVAGFLSDALTDRLSSAFAYVAVFGIAFLLVSIAFAVIGNLINVVFSLPGLRLVDMIAGTALGLAKGLLIVFGLAVIVRYIGIFAPERLEGTTVLYYLVNNNPIAGILGI